MFIYMYMQYNFNITSISLSPGNDIISLFCRNGLGKMEQTKCKFPMATHKQTTCLQIFAKLTIVNTRKQMNSNPQTQKLNTSTFTFYHFECSMALVVQKRLLTTGAIEPIE